MLSAGNFSLQQVWAQRKCVSDLLEQALVRGSHGHAGLAANADTAQHLGILWIDHY